MSKLNYIIYILATPKKGGRPEADVRISSSSYQILEWLDKFLSDTESKSYTEPEPLRNQYETRTLDIHKDIVSESDYKKLIRVCLKAYCEKINPSSITVTDVKGKTFLQTETTEQNPLTEEDGMTLVRMASTMLEHEEFLNWKKNSVHMWITNKSVIF